MKDLVLWTQKYNLKELEEEIFNEIKINEDIIFNIPKIIRIGDKANISIGQKKALYHGLNFGWDTFGANPELYDEDGNYVPNKKYHT